MPLILLQACGGSANGAGPSSSSPALSAASTAMVSTSAVTSASLQSSSLAPSSQSASAAARLKGVFIDSPVEGLGYVTESQSGFTNSEGEFYYLYGETIVFSLGDIRLPQIMAQARITPFTLAGTDNIDDIRVINIARLLQTLDVDGNPANGIAISNQAHLAAKGISVDFSSLQFADLVAGLLANSGVSATRLVDRSQAQAHLSASLAATCGTDHPKVGQVAWLRTLAHKVSGRAQILDNCTLEITQFNYDGKGLPDVYVYGGLNGNYSFALGDNLFGKAFVNQTLRVPLAPGDLERMDAISIWCVQVGANFGDGVFVAP
jgi:hypothetical protein